MNFTVDLGMHGSPSLFHINDGFYFRCYKTREYVAYFRCTQSRMGCPVRALIRVGENFQTNNEIHNHEPNFELVPFIQERRMLIDQSRRLDIASFQDIFNYYRAEFQDLTYTNLYRTMLRERRNVLPNLHSLGDLVTVLEDPTYACVSATSNFNEILYRDSCRLPSGKTVILFMGPRSTSFLEIAPSLFILHTIVGGTYNLLTIGCVWERRVLSLGFLLMDGGELVDFNAAFYMLRAHLNRWNFQEGICGEAFPLPSAFANIFGVPLCPSLFDFIQAAKMYVIPRELLQTPNGKYLFGMCFALTLLPEDILPVGLVFMQNECARLQANNVLSSLQNVSNMPHFSLCIDKDRSHYGIDFLKNHLERKFQNFSGDIYVLTRYIVKTTERTLRDIDAVERGEGPSDTSSPASIMDDQQSQQLYRCLLRPPLNIQVSVANFLRHIADKLQPWLGVQ